MNDPERANDLNERANDLFGFSMREFQRHGRADAADVAEFERTAAALNAEIIIDSQGCDQWLESHSARDYLPSEE